ncbi:MAG: hypothetical protein M0Z46_06275 [Actinomycetota bacterium]|nr:hypothetical protein [Actinomycetota bacterium]
MHPDGLDWVSNEVMDTYSLADLAPFTVVLFLAAWVVQRPFHRPTDAPHDGRGWWWRLTHRH